MGIGIHKAYSLVYDRFRRYPYPYGQGDIARLIRESACTLRLLNTGTKRALTMMVRAHVAFLLAGLTANMPVYAAIGLGTYAVYTLDNVVGGVEDKVNGKEFNGANKEITLVAVLMAFIGCIALMGLNGLLPVPFIPIAIALMYSKGLKLGDKRLRLKEGGYGIKNLVIGLSKGGVIGASVLILSDSMAIGLIVFIFFGMKSFIVSTLNDMADMRGDASAGIRTLPLYLGRPRLKALLLLLTAVSYALIGLGSVTGVLVSHAFIMAFSLAASATAIIAYDPSWHYSKCRLRQSLRSILSDGEFIVPLVLVGLI